VSRLSPNQLTVRKVETAKDGSYSDGGNLWLTVSGKAKTWSVRFTSPTTGKRREMGLGPFHDVSLAVARDLATDARKLVRQGIDPIERRKVTRAEQKPKPLLTFQAVAERYIIDQTAGWRDPRLPGIWASSLKRLAYPALGEMNVAAIGTDDVTGVLRPIWETTTETADRVRGRIERILDYARTQGWREGENPARWRGHLAHILPKPSSVAREQHHPTIPWKDIGPVMLAMARSQGIGAMAVRFACLTAARSGEVRGARWSELDLKAKTWTIPGERMKMHRAHVIPLSGPAIEILTILKALASKPDALVFPGGRAGRPLSDVAELWPNLGDGGLREAAYRGG